MYLWSLSPPHSPFFLEDGEEAVFQAWAVEAKDITLAIYFLTSLSYNDQSSPWDLLPVDILMDSSIFFELK